MRTALFLGVVLLSGLVSACGSAKPPPPQGGPKTAEHPENKALPPTDQPVGDEANAIALLEKLGAGILTDEKQAGKPVIAVSLNGCEVTDANLKELAGLKQLQNLGLGNTKVTRAGLKELAALGRLQTLNLSSTQLADEDLRELAAHQATPHPHPRRYENNGCGIEGARGCQASSGAATRQYRSD
jgi:hypothetical protein